MFAYQPASVLPGPSEGTMRITLWDWAQMGAYIVAAVAAYAFVEAGGLPLLWTIFTGG